MVPGRLSTTGTDGRRWTDLLTPKTKSGVKVRRWGPTRRGTGIRVRRSVRGRV